MAINRMQPEDAAQFIPYTPATTFPHGGHDYAYRSPLNYHAPVAQQFQDAGGASSPGYMARYGRPGYAQVVPGTHGHGGGYDAGVGPGMVMQGPMGWGAFRRRWF